MTAADRSGDLAERLAAAEQTITLLSERLLTTVEIVNELLRAELDRRGGRPSGERQRIRARIAELERGEAEAPPVRHLRVVR